LRLSVVTRGFFGALSRPGRRAFFRAGLALAPPQRKTCGVRFLPLLWIAVAGCDGCDGDHTAAPAPSVSATATATAVPESGPRLLVAAHPGGKVLFRITVEGERLRVDGDETL